MPKEHIRLKAPTFKKAAAAAGKILLTAAVAAVVIWLFDAGANAIIDLIL